MLLSSWGLPRQGFLDSPEQAMLCVLLVALWGGMGGSILIFSAGLAGISEELYEAGRIDGAGTLQEFWYLTLPLLKPTILFVMITGFIGGLQAFALPLIMTGGGPVDSTRVLAQYMYEMAFQNMRMGRASAMVFILFVIILFITLVQLRIFRRGGVESY
jgi:multiple sugar transport system permease protein